MTEYREVDFIPTDWVERAAWWPGLQVYSRLARVPVDPCPRRRKTDFVATTSVDVIERLLREAFDEPFQSVDLDEVPRIVRMYRQRAGDGHNAPMEPGYQIQETGKRP